MATAPAEKAPRTCFVIGPIGKPDSSTRKHADWVLDGLIIPALEGDPFNYTVLRAEADDRPGQISAQVIERLFDADLVVADLTELNANVMYELAIRHMLPKHTILVCHSGTTLPFDLQDARTIFFEITDYSSVEEARSRIASQAEEIENPEFAPSNPVTAARGVAELARSADSKDQLIADLLRTVSGLDRRVDTLEIGRREPLKYPPQYLEGILEPNALLTAARFGQLVEPIAPGLLAEPPTAVSAGTSAKKGQVVEAVVAKPDTPKDAPDKG